MASGLLEAACILFAVTTAVLIRREWRRHKRRHPKHPIPTVSLTDLADRFKWDSPQHARDGVVYFTSNANNRLPATPSDLETYVLAALAKDARHMFEFGTCTGRTTYLWGLNSPSEARITTLTLSPEVDSMQLGDDMRHTDIEHALAESTFDTFVYSDTPVATKVAQLFQDSATLDTTPYRRQMDLIFVDGGHSYSYVKNDSLKALEMVAPGGRIVWHDYRGARCKETAGVYRYLNELHRTHPLQMLEGTSLVFYRKPARRTDVQASGPSRAA